MVYGHTQYAYTVIFDAVFEIVNELDKFTSLSNGICTRIHPLPWNYTYNYYRIIYHKNVYAPIMFLGKYYQPFHAYPGKNVFSISSQR